MGIPKNIPPINPCVNLKITLLTFGGIGVIRFKMKFLIFIILVIFLSQGVFAKKIGLFCECTSAVVIKEGKAEKGCFYKNKSFTLDFEERILDDLKVLRSEGGWPYIIKEMTDERIIAERVPLNPELLSDNLREENCTPDRLEFNRYTGAMKESYVCKTFSETANYMCKASEKQF